MRIWKRVPYPFNPFSSDPIPYLASYCDFIFYSHLYLFNKSNFNEKDCKDKTSIGCLFENILQSGSENEYTESDEYEYEEISAAGISDDMMDNVDKLLRGDLRIVLWIFTDCWT